MAEGMELTRGTKKIIQEAINTVEPEHRSDRIRLCEEFCRIVETKYTGGAMSYQLKRMGNTYPFELLSDNGWSIQDAIDNDLVVFVTSDWFTYDALAQDENGNIFFASPRTVTSVDKRQATLMKGFKSASSASVLTEDSLANFDLAVTSDTSVDKTMTRNLSVWSRVSDEEQFALENKLFWLTSLVVGHKDDNSPVYLTDIEALNMSESQAKAKGLEISKENAVKIPLKSTAPILEAIDKYLYDKTGQFTL